jgi:hypothetical protein
VTSSSAATPPASGTPMDLIGKTGRWESGDSWFTATVVEWIAETQTWRGEVVNPGTFPGYEPGGVTYFGVRRYLTVIDSEPDTQDPECE